MGRIVGKLALTMPIAFSTTAQIIGSTSAPREAFMLGQTGKLELGDDRRVGQTYRLHLREINASQYRFGTR